MPRNAGGIYETCRPLVLVSRRQPDPWQDQQGAGGMEGLDGLAEHGPADRSAVQRPQVEHRRYRDIEAAQGPGLSSALKVASACEWSTG